MKEGIPQGLKPSSVAALPPGLKVRGYPGSDGESDQKQSDEKSESETSVATGIG
jgi:hypothetical protein